MPSQTQPSGADASALALAPEATVAIAGASGFVGKALVEALATRFPVIALGRSASRSAASEGVVFRKCDLYNAEEAESGLRGATTAVYLVHSMVPSARLVQASFADLDLVCADNFARAAANAGVKHIVYLGGLTPESEGGVDALSRHLRSREEVERVLASHGAAVTTLRAGMVIGAGGSSFRILLRLAQRLPWMLIPRWGSSRSQPIGLHDVVRLLVHAIEHPQLAGQAYDVGAPSVMSYADMLRRTGALLGRRLWISELPFNVPVVSLLWVSAITGAPLDLVMPLVESLKHEMVARQNLGFQEGAGFALAPFDELVTAAIGEEKARASFAPPSALKLAIVEAGAQPRPRVLSRAVSLQRFPLPEGLTAQHVAEAYFRWLPRAMRPFIRVAPLAEPGCAFWIAGFPHALLELTLDAARSDADRAVYRISGGSLLARGGTGGGSLEFRAVLEGRYVMALVSNFEPRLPWFIYKATQALAHALVMWAFGRYLRSRAERKRDRRE